MLFSLPPYPTARQSDTSEMRCAVCGTSFVSQEGPRSLLPGYCPAQRLICVGCVSSANVHEVDGRTHPETLPSPGSPEPCICMRCTRVQGRRRGHLKTSSPIGHRHPFSCWFGECSDRRPPARSGRQLYQLSTVLVRFWRTSRSSASRCRGGLAWTV